MKILHLYKTYFTDSYGGTEQFIYQLARETARRGAEVHVLSLSAGTDHDIRILENHHVHRIRRDFEIASSGFSLRAFREFSLLAEEADVVHYHHPWPFADMLHFACRIVKPTVLTYHSDIIRQVGLLHFYKPLMKRFYRSVDRIVATSPNYLNSSEILRNYPEKTCVIPIGLDPLTYPDPDPSDLKYWRARFHEPFFFFVGVLRYYKGLHVLLDAINGTDYPVVVAGAGPVEQELRRHAAGIKAQVSFLGELSEQDKAALFKLCYAVVFPSHLRAEAFGISLLEGAMFGKPLISCELGSGSSYINVHGETGLVVPPSDPIALRVALDTLHADPALAERMGGQARRRFEQHFTAKTMGEQYMRLYEDIRSERVQKF